MKNFGEKYSLRKAFEKIIFEGFAGKMFSNKSILSEKILMKNVPSENF